MAKVFLTHINEFTFILYMSIFTLGPGLFTEVLYIKMATSVKNQLPLFCVLNYGFYCI